MKEKKRKWKKRKKLFYTLIFINLIKIYYFFYYKNIFDLKFNYITNENRQYKNTGVLKNQ